MKKLGDIVDLKAVRQAKDLERARAVHADFEAGEQAGASKLAQTNADDKSHIEGLIAGAMKDTHSKYHTFALRRHFGDGHSLETIMNNPLHPEVRRIVKDRHSEIISDANQVADHLYKIHNSDRNWTSNSAHLITNKVGLLRRGARDITLNAKHNLL